MDFDRTKNARRNILWGLFNKMVAMIIPFVMRTIIIYTLGNLYLGLNSLFTSVLNALNLAELGVGSALVFAMYKPVAENDKIKISALLMLYRRAYLIIGCFVLGLGIALLPFLRFFINGSVPLGINLYVIYVIQLLTTSFGYFFMAYKSSLFIAYQRTDITSKVELTSEIIMYTVQILALLIFKNYYVYIFAALCRVIVYNILIGWLADRQYPDLKAGGNVSKEDRRLIFVKTGALMGHKVASVIINSIDNIFVSMYIGLEMVAIYNNYYYVITAVSGLFLMLLNGLNSIIGNYLIKENKDKILNLFYTTHYITSFCICVCCTCFMNLYQPFISVWVGENSLLGLSSVVLLAVCFYSIRIRTIGTLFEDAAGLWEKDVLKSYLMVVIDLIIDIYLLKNIGINGALISTIATMLFAFFYESIVLHKFCLKTKQRKYLFETFVYSVATVLSCAVSFEICNMVSYNLYVSLVVNTIISIIVSSIVYITLTFKMSEFNNSIIFIKEKVLRRNA